MPAAQSPDASHAPSVWGPRTWGLHLVGLVCVLSAAWLGWWQLEAWQLRREAEARDLTEAAPVQVSDVFGPNDPFPADRVGQPVEIAGTWVPDGTVYVEGREQDGRDGYWVVTPLEIGPGDSAMLVVRGWTADLAAVPPPPTGAAELTGWLQPGEGARGLTDEDPSDDVLPQLRIPDALQHVDQDLYAGYVVVSTGATSQGGLAPATLDQLPEVGRFTALRNLLYGLEWWLFGAFAGFVWWRWVRDQRELADAHDAALAGAVAGADPGADDEAGDEAGDESPADAT